MTTQFDPYDLTVMAREIIHNWRPPHGHFEPYPYEPYPYTIPGNWDSAKKLEQSVDDAFEFAPERYFHGHFIIEVSAELRLLLQLSVCRELCRMPPKEVDRFMDLLRIVIDKELEDVTAHHRIQEGLRNDPERKEEAEATPNRLGQHFDGTEILDLACRCLSPRKWDWDACNAFDYWFENRSIRANAMASLDKQDMEGRSWARARLY